MSCEQGVFTSSEFFHRHIMGGWGICTPDPKVLIVKLIHLVTSQQLSVFLGSIYKCLKQLVFKSLSISNKKDSAQRYLTHWPIFALRGGTQTFIRHHRIVLLKKNKCSVKM